MIKTNEKAPAFTLKNQFNQGISLSDYKKKKVLLSFHPLAWTPVCSIQMASLEVKTDKLSQLNAVALGISVDSTFSKKEWAEYLDIERTNLLSDFWPHGEISQQYDVFLKDTGVSQRANIIINEKGIIEFVKLYQIDEIPDIEEILQILKQ